VTVEVFSSPGCSYCDRAKALLESRGIAFLERDLSADPKMVAELRRRLPRSKVIPQIFIDGEHIGGYEDLRHFDEGGELAKLLGGQ